jgi:hypothetical protein
MRRARRAAGLGMAAAGHQGDAGGKPQSAAVEAANFAALGYRDRFILRWKNCRVWEPLEFFVRNDGTWIRTDIAPTHPDIDPQFIELAASPWFPTALHADVRT